MVYIRTVKVTFYIHGVKFQASGMFDPFSIEFAHTFLCSLGI